MKRAMRSSTTGSTTVNSTNQRTRRPKREPRRLSRVAAAGTSSVMIRSDMEGYSTVGAANLRRAPPCKPTHRIGPEFHVAAVGLLRGCYGKNPPLVAVLPRGHQLVEARELQMHDHRLVRLGL